MACLAFLSCFGGLKVTWTQSRAYAMQFSTCFSTTFAWKTKIICLPCSTNFWQSYTRKLATPCNVIFWTWLQTQPNWLQGEYFRYIIFASFHNEINFRMPVQPSLFRLNRKKFEIVSHTTQDFNACVEILMDMLECANSPEEISYTIKSLANCKRKGKIGKILADHFRAGSRVLTASTCRTELQVYRQFKELTNDRFRVAENLALLGESVDDKCQAKLEMISIKVAQKKDLPKCISSCEKMCKSSVSFNLSGSADHIFFQTKSFRFQS